MKFLKNILDLFLYSNIFISVCAAAMVVQTYFLFHLEVNWFYTAFIFSSSVVLYNYPSLFLSGDARHSERQRWVRDHKRIIWLISLAALAAVCILLFFLPLKLIAWFVPLTVLSFSYFLPITNLRAIPAVKAVIVALVWTCITYLFPLMLLYFQEQIPVPFGEGRGEGIRFFFLLALAVAFNIRDIEGDRKANVRTLPVIYGLRLTKILCFVLLLVFSVLVFFSPYPVNVKVAFLVSVGITAVFIFRSSESRSEYFYSLWMDGMILLQAGLIYLAEVFSK